MGVIDSPVVPVAYRERDLRPVGKVEKGVEVWPGTERSHIFWADSYGAAVKAAEEAGYKL